MLTFKDHILGEMHWTSCFTTMMHDEIHTKTWEDNEVYVQHWLIESSKIVPCRSFHLGLHFKKQSSCQTKVTPYPLV
jgi:hypothetical protein